MTFGKYIQRFPYPQLRNFKKLGTRILHDQKVRKYSEQEFKISNHQKFPKILFSYEASFHKSLLKTYDR